MPSLDIAALAAQCRITPEAIYQVLEDLQTLLDEPHTITSQIIVPGTTSIPAVSTMEIENLNTVKTLRGIVFCSASCVVTVTSPVMVLGHSLSKNGAATDQFGTWSGESGWNALYVSSDDRVLPPICAKVDVPPSSTVELEHLIDVNTGFTTGTSSSRLAESRVMVFIGGY